MIGDNFRDMTGSRLGSNRTLVREYENQFRTTIPRALALLLEIKDRDTIVWSIQDNCLLMKVEKRNNVSSTRAI